MKLVVPTITAKNTEEFNDQTDLVASFSDFAHIDIADAGFKNATSLIPYSDVYVEPVLTSSIHIMYEDPTLVTKALLELAEPPRMIILQAESDPHKLKESIELLQEAKVLFGLALLQDTEPDDCAELIERANQVLIFSGNLGEHGGTADLTLTPKISRIKRHNSKVEIAWDGGINSLNIEDLAKAGVDVFYVGGAIHQAEDPAGEFRKLQELVENV
jgi:ribulose-phosphate 3-epimerase